MMNNPPLVSVLMTAYNREKYIGEAIRSVLSSSFTDFELIIVDDRSSDATVDIAKHFAAQDSRVSVYVNDVNLGDYPNRNKAASYARGAYIKFLDADDIFYFHGLEVMVRSMLEFPEAGFGLSSHADKNKPFPVCIDPLTTYREHFYENAHFDRAPGSSIIKLEAFNQVNGFSGARMIGDYELWFKLARYYKMVKFPFDLYWNRVHEEQESRSVYAKQYPLLRRKVLKEALEHPDCPLDLVERERLKKGRNPAIVKRIAWRFFLKTLISIWLSVSVCLFLTTWSF